MNAFGALMISTRENGRFRVVCEAQRERCQGCFVSGIRGMQRLAFTHDPPHRALRRRMLDVYFPDEGAELAGLVRCAGAHAAVRSAGEGDRAAADARGADRGDPLRDAGRQDLSGRAGDSLLGNAAAAARAAGAGAVAAGRDPDRGADLQLGEPPPAPAEPPLRLQGCVRDPAGAQARAGQAGVRSVENAKLPTLNAQRSTERLRAALAKATSELLSEIGPGGHWIGELSSSALSTATAVVALGQVDAKAHGSLIRGGLSWLAGHQNADGGWGDTIKSRSNISTTALGWAAFGAARADGEFAESVARA